MFYSHSEISMMSKSRIDDIRENYKRNIEYKEGKSKKSFIQILLVTKIFTFVKK